MAAKGITADTLAGEAKTDLTAKKELFGELKLPTAFTDGDDAQIQVTVHNSLVEKGPIRSHAQNHDRHKTVEEHKTIDATAKGPTEADVCHRRPPPRAGCRETGTATNRPTKAEKPVSDNEAAFELTVAAAGQTDVIRRVVPIHPFGMPVYATAGGSASADTTVWVEAPPQDAARWAELANA